MRAGTNQFITFVNSSTKQIVIAFKGSNDTENFVSDLLNDGAAAYADIAAQAQAALISIKSAYPGYSIVTDGHSLGGGMAQTFSVINNLSGYGQNSLPIAAASIKADGNFQTQLATWKSNSTFTETNSVGDIATGNYTAGIAKGDGDVYIYTPPTGLVSTPYTNQILNGLKIINQTSSSPSIFTPMLVDTGAAWSSFNAILAHSIGGVVAGLQQVIAGTASLVPNISASNMMNLMKYFNASAGTLNSNGSGTVTEPDGSQFNWSVPVITDGTASGGGTAVSDNGNANFNNLSFTQPSANQTVITSTLADGTKGSITFTDNSDGTTSVAFVHDNSDGTVQFTQTNTISSSGQLTAVAISGTGDDVALGNNVALTLAHGASVSVIEPVSYNYTEAVTYDTSGGKSLTLAAGTSGPQSQYDDSGTVSVGLDAPDGNGVGTLEFNTSTNAASFALTLEGGAPGFNDHVSFALPGIGKDTVAALSATTTPFQALKDYLADLGYTSSLTTLNFNDLNPTGTAYDVTGQFYGTMTAPDGTLEDMIAYVTNGVGAVMTGSKTYQDAVMTGARARQDSSTDPAYNFIDILTGTFVDLTQDTWSDMQALTLNTGATAELTAAQFGSLPDITGSGTLVITTAGNVSLTAVDAQPDHGTFNLTAQGWGGTVLTGDATNGQVLTASLYGNDTLNAGSGFFDGLVAGQGVDILNAPGFDTILAADGLAAGSKASGVAGETVLDAGGDISHATISGITTLTLGGNSPLGLTASQLALFTTIYLAGDNAIDAEAGGTYNLLNAPFANAAAGMSIALNAVSNSATTLEGNDTSTGTGLISLLTALGNGADTLSTGGAAGDSLTASGSGNDKLTAGNGNNDTLSATGNGNDTLKAANDNAATLLRPAANDDCALQITLLRVA